MYKSMSNETICLNCRSDLFGSKVVSNFPRKKGAVKMNTVNANWRLKHLEYLKCTSPQFGKFRTPNLKAHFDPLKHLDFVRFFVIFGPALNLKS